MDLLRGTLSGLPPEKKTTVRVFLSSTFSDTYGERNAFLRSVQPKLYDYCRNRGLDFQVADMRWGVRDEAADVHTTTAVVLAALHDSMKISHGPAFLGILGDRYGSRLLPANIESQEFDVLMSTAITNEIDTSILTTWYRKDKNAIPDTHVLQPITTILPHYGDEDPENAELARADKDSWNKVNDEMRNLLHELSKLANTAGNLAEEKAFKYWWSVTEEEMITALSYVERDSKCVVFMRNLDNINLQDSVASRYVDMKRPGELDKEAQILLHHEKNVRVPERLRQDNIYHYHVPWSRSGIDPNYIRHQSYLRNFCHDVEEHLRRQIELAASQDSSEYADHQVCEVLRHLHICRYRLESFTARESLLEEIHQRLLQLNSPRNSSNAMELMERRCTMPGVADVVDNVREIDSEYDSVDLLDNWMSDDLSPLGQTKKPLIISGSSGSGKSSLACAIFHRIITWFPNCIRIIRFVRATQHSSTARKLILSIIHQISKTYDLKLPDDTLISSRPLSKLKTILKVLLTKVIANDRPLFIILDDLERLGDRTILEAFPELCLPNVHIIITHSCEMDVVEGIGRFSVLEMPPLSHGDEKEIARKLLKRRNRRLTRTQFELLTSEEAHSSPLTIRILTSLVDLWHSYDEPDDGMIKMMNSPEIEHYIVEFFLDKLEVNHGYALVSRAFGYLAVAQIGLSHAELEGILSLDDEVLQDSYVHQLPPDPNLIKLPQLLWRRIYDEMKEFLCEMYGGTFYVLKWQHWQFAKVTTRRYAPADSAITKELHSMLADYFMGIWHDQVKPLELYKHKKGVYPDCKRGVPAQPLYSSFNQVNMRVLDELPYHLLKSGRYQELLDKCITNIEWVSAHVTTHSLNETVRTIKELTGQFGASLIDHTRRFITSVNLVADAVGSNNGERLMEQLYALALTESKNSPLIRMKAEALADYIKASVIPHLYPVTPCLYLPRNILMDKLRLRSMSSATTCLNPFLDLKDGRILFVDLHRQGGTSVKITTTGEDHETCDCGVFRGQVRCLRTYVKKRKWVVATVLRNLDNETDILLDTCQWKEVQHSYWDTQKLTIVEVDPGGDIAAVYQEDGDGITLWDLTSSFSSRFPFPKTRPICPSIIRWSRSGQYILIVQYNSMDLLILAAKSKTFVQHTSSFPIVSAARGNGDTFILSGRGLIFLNPESGRIVNATGFSPAQPISLLRESKSGCFLLTGNYAGNKPLHLWDLMEGHRVVSEIHEHGGLHAADFFNDNKWLVYTCAKSQPYVILWLFGRGAGNYYDQAIRLRYIIGHSDQVHGLFLAESDDVFFSYGADQRALRWRRSTFEEEAMTHLFRARQRASGRLTAVSASTPSMEPQEDMEEGIIHRTTGLVVSQLYQILAVIRSSGWLTIYRLPAIDHDHQRLSRGYPTSLSNVEVCDRWLAFIAGGSSVYVWDLKTLTEFHKISIPRREISCIALSSEYIVLCSGGTAELSGVAVFYDLKTGDILEEMKCPNGFNRIIIAPNESYVATHRGNIPIINHRGSQMVPALAPDRYPSSATCTCLEMSDDGRVVATGDSEGVVRILDGFTGVIVSYLRQTVAVTVARFLLPSSGHPLRLVTGGMRHLFVWSVAAQRLERAIERHSGPLKVLSISADHRFLVSASVDRELILWKIDGWSCLASVNFHWPVSCVAATADLSYIFIDNNAACAPFTVLMPNTSLEKSFSTHSDDNESEEHKEVDDEGAQAQFVAQARGLVEAFSPPSSGSQNHRSEMCTIL